MHESRSSAPSSASTECVLGIRFFNGTAENAVDHLKAGGYAVIPAMPALIKLRYDAEYRRALQEANLALADSDFLCLIWRTATGRHLHKISGLSYVRALIQRPEFRETAAVAWVVASEDARGKAHAWLTRQGLPVQSSDFFIVSPATETGDYHKLLLETENRKPRHIVIALKGTTQEKLASYLREYMLFKPTIHCVGAALDLLSGHDQAIPAWAEKLHIGWLPRSLAQPQMIFPRLGIAAAVAWMVFRYRSELPPLRPHWADV